jgi:hypothetical protein
VTSAYKKQNKKCCLCACNLLYTSLIKPGKNACNSVHFILRVSRGETVQQTNRKRENDCLIGCCALVMETVKAFEMSLNLYQTTRHYNPEDSHLTTRRHDSPKSYDDESCTLMMEAVNAFETCQILPDHKAQHPQRPPSSYSSPWLHGVSRKGAEFSAPPRHLPLFISFGLASSRTTAGIAFTVWYSAPSLLPATGAAGGSEWRRLLNRRMADAQRLAWMSQLLCVQRPAIVQAILYYPWEWWGREKAILVRCCDCWQHTVPGPSLLAI